MSKPRQTSFVAVVLQTMGWPLVWGLGMCCGLYALYQSGIIQGQLFHRYCASHPVQYVEVALFCIGVAAIAIKLLNVIGQFGTLDDIAMTPRPAGGQAPQDAATMLKTLGELPSYMRRSYLAERLRAALEHVHRKGAALGLDAELKHLSDLDAARQQEGYALLRVIIWATPMLGFLGTVIGITLALGDLSPQSLVNEPEVAMQGLLGGLSIAFDTTALALMLAMVLMFAQFLTSRLEAELIEAVDDRVAAHLVGRFEQFAGADDPYLVSIRCMSEQVIKSLDELFARNSQSTLNSMEDLVQRQTQLWQQSIDTASSSWSAAQEQAQQRFLTAQSNWTASQEKWDELSEMAAAQMSVNVNRALDASLRTHISKFGEAERITSDRITGHWDRLHKALSENAHLMQTQQGELARQGDALLQVVSSTAELSQLQQSLNDNLSSLSVYGKLDETVAHLSAAINLLNARLGATADATRLRVFRDPDQGAA